MENKALYLLLLSIIALLLGFAVSYFNPIQVNLGAVPFTAMIAGIFFAGTLFFGYLGFVPMLLFGLQTGADKNAAIFLYILPSIIAAYAGIKLGTALHEDFNNKQRFLLHGKTILLLLLAAIIMALVIELTIPMIISYWPQDFLGMNIEKGSTISGLINQLTGMIKK